MLVVFTVAIAQSYRIRHCHLPAMRMPFRGFLLESSKKFRVAVGLAILCVQQAQVHQQPLILGPFYGRVESN
ncbi:hypothetical protein V6N13_106142 [Hibiscus sabdariffa]